MGGLVAIRAILKSPSFFSGTVLEGPLIIPTEKPSAVMNQISKLAKLVAPDYIYLPLDLNDVSHYQVNLLIADDAKVVLARTLFLIIRVT